MRRAAGTREDGGGPLAAQFLIAAGVLTVVNDHLPDNGHLDVGALDAIGVAAALIGLVAWRLPWRRWSPRAALTLALLAFGLIAVADRFGGVSDFSYGIYFVLVFVWVGLAQPPLTAFALAPAAAAAYLLPLLTVPHPPPHGAWSAPVVIPVCVLVGEALARSVAGQYAARATLAERAERAEQQRGHEQAIIDAVGDGLLVVDRTGRVQSCNRAATELLEMPSDALVGRPVPVPVDETGLPMEHEVSPKRWVEASAAPLPGGAETVVALHDITRQRALKEAQDLFLATTSHELRTPLTVITGYLTTLQRRWDVLTEAQRLDALAMAAARADGLVTLVNHLLLAAQAGVGRSVLTVAPFDIVAVANRIVGDFATVAARHELVLQVPDDLPDVLGDEATVEPILGQLLENAVKYSPDGGQITVALRTQGDSVVLEVADEGVGLPPGGAARIFTPFVQGGGGDRREYGGVGLGLHIVRQLVERQGGAVSAGNRRGGGAVFTVTLPLAAEGGRAAVRSGRSVSRAVPDPTEVRR